MDLKDYMRSLEGFREELKREGNPTRSSRQRSSQSDDGSRQFFAKGDRVRKIKSLAQEKRKHEALPGMGFRPLKGLSFRPKGPVLPIREEREVTRQTKFKKPPRYMDPSFVDKHIRFEERDTPPEILEKEALSKAKGRSNARGKLKTPGSSMMGLNDEALNLLENSTIRERNNQKLFRQGEPVSFDFKNSESEEGPRARAISIKRKNEKILHYPATPKGFRGFKMQCLPSKEDGSIPTCTGSDNEEYAIPNHFFGMIGNPLPSTKT